MSSDINAILKSAKAELKHIPGARLDAELLLAHVLEKNRVWLYARPEFKVSQYKIKKFINLVNKRKTGMPLAYLTGHKEFWSMNFKVTKDTLIPRPETELLVELALKNIDNNSKILELGTGSGAIAIALASECPVCTITATDISEATLNVARDNAKFHQANTVSFIRSNWFKNLENQKFDLIITNPPYVADYETELLNIETQFEPQSALFAGPDGLDAIRKILKCAKNHLNPGGMIILEHGFNQADAVQDLMLKLSFKNIKTYKDPQSHPRATTAEF